MMDKVIEAINVNKFFKNVHVLKNINLSVERGEVFGFLGRNGAGKSTLINVITNIYLADEGDVNINTFKERCIGVMPDAINLYSELTTKAFLKYMYSVKKHSFSTNLANELLTQVALDYDKIKNIKIRNFSFGMKKNYL